MKINRDKEKSCIQNFKTYFSRSKKKNKILDVIQLLYILMQKNQRNEKMGI